MKPKKIDINSKLLIKYNIKGPRYTSYPTTPEWKWPQNSDSTIKATLTSIRKNSDDIALYIHIPFCEQLCHFCSCSMIPQGRLQEEKSVKYLSLLKKEIELIYQQIGKKRISHLHLGGGTPNFFPIYVMNELFQLLHKSFDLTHQLEQSIEVDPRHLEKEYTRTLHSLGFNRISMGIQDFDPQVQKNINRIQPYELIEEVCHNLRAFQLPINFDLVYGLPGQTLENFKQTCQKVIQLKPNRIALYSFAFLPHMKKHHTLFKEEQMPTPQEKMDIFIQSRNQFLKEGYQPIGMDHFALPQDSLSIQFSNKRLFRNFMGYSLKYSKNMLGIGFSSISFLNNTYLQNTKDLKFYEQQLTKGSLPIVHGHLLNEDDKIRKWCIDKIMCEFYISKKEFKQVFNKTFDQYFKSEEQAFHTLEQEKLIINQPNHLQATPLGEFFVRNIAIQFDTYFKKPQGFRNFSKTI